MAYTAATVIQKDPVGLDGRIHLIVSFTGASEPEQRLDYYVDGGATLAQGNAALRVWAQQTIAKLDNRKQLDTAVILPFTINLTPIVPPAQTAAEIWLEKARRLQRLKSLGLTAAQAVSDVSALQADVDATYLTAYKDQV